MQENLYLQPVHFHFPSHPPGHQAATSPLGGPGALQACGSQTGTILCPICPQGICVTVWRNFVSPSTRGCFWHLVVRKASDMLNVLQCTGWASPAEHCLAEDFTSGRLSLVRGCQSRARAAELGAGKGAGVCILDTGSLSPGEWQAGALIMHFPKTEGKATR